MQRPINLFEWISFGSRDTVLLFAAAHQRRQVFTDWRRIELVEMLFRVRIRADADTDQVDHEGQQPQKMP